MVIEMDSLPRFLPEGSELSGMESRLHWALAQKRWNQHPDWKAGLERAGFSVVEQRSITTVGRSTPELTARYARLFLERIRTALDGVAAPADLMTLDALLATHGPESLDHRTDLEVSGSRTVWAARKP